MTLKRKFFFWCAQFKSSFSLCKSLTKTKMYNLSLNNFFVWECIPLMDTYKWITNISTPYAYQIGTIRKNRRSKKDESLSKYLKMVILHVQMRIFLYSTAHICNKNSFLWYGYIFCYQLVEKCDIIVSDVPLAIFRRHFWSWWRMFVTRFFIWWNKIYVIYKSQVFIFYWKYWYLDQKILLIPR